MVIIEVRTPKIDRPAAHGGQKVTGRCGARQTHQSHKGAGEREKICTPLRRVDLQREVGQQHPVR